MKDNEMKNELIFIEKIKNNSDFIRAYIVKEEINTIWIVINNSEFKFNKKYLSSARQFKLDNNCEFNIVIFEEEQLQEISEQLTYYSDYKIVEK